MGGGIRPKKDFSRHQQDMVKVGLQQSLNIESPESLISLGEGSANNLSEASKDTLTHARPADNRFDRKGQGCGQPVEWCEMIYGCGEMEDLKHSDHIILCSKCKTETPNG